MILVLICIVMPNFKLTRKAKADLKSIALYTEHLHKRMLPKVHLL